MYKYYIASYSDIPTSNRQMLASEKLRICNPLLLYKENNWSMKLRNVLWYFLAHLFNMNKYVFKQYDIIKNNRIISSAKVVSYIPFFRFMSRDGIHICSCYTIPEERGKGYYPYLISKIMSDFPDLDVIRVEDVYYMVSTTMHFMPGCAILRSYNLLDWEFCSYVYDELEKTEGETLSDKKGIYGKGF